MARIHIRRKDEAGSDMIQQDVGLQQRKRNFASGWVSGKDPSVMALIWQVLDERVDYQEFEVEVVKDLDMVETLRGTSLDEIRTRLVHKYDA